MSTLCLERNSYSLMLQRRREACGGDGTKGTTVMNCVTSTR